MSLTNGVLTALPAPPGYIVNFDNPERQSDVATYIIVGVGNLLSILFMGQHLYVNGVVRRKLGLIDGMWERSLNRNPDFEANRAQSLSCDRMG